MWQDLENDVLDLLQKSLFEPPSPEVLYDIASDLWETKNLIDKPEYKGIAEKMRKGLDANILESEDVLFLPESELEKISKTSTPYEFRQDKTRYPIKQIYEVAKLAGFRGKDVMLQQLEFLKSGSEIQRYWAAMGLRSQEKELLLPFADQITNSLNDDYLPIAITSAAILYELNQGKEAEELLKKTVLSENKHLALMTINYLIYTDHKAPFIDVVTQVYRRDKDTYETSAASKDFLGSLGLVPNTFEYR